MYWTADTLEGLPRGKRVALINSLSGFKSANLLGTRSRQGQENLAIISSCFHLGTDPALMGLIMRPHSVDRHSLEYLEDTGVFTLNAVHDEILDAAHQTAARYPRDQSEFQATGLTAQYQDGFAAPYVAQSHIKYGLSRVESHTLVNNTVMVVGALQHLYVPDSCLAEDGYVDQEKAGTVALSGLDRYHRTRRLCRLSYAKPGTPPKRL